MHTLVRWGVSYQIDSAFANRMQTPRLLHACQKTVIQSVISVQSQLKTQLSKHSSTAVPIGGGPALQDSAGLMLSNLWQLLHLLTAINIKNQVFDCVRAVIDSKQWKKIPLKQ